MMDSRLSNKRTYPIGKSFDITPLMIAAGKPNREDFYSLVSSGADIHFRNDFGWSILYCACYGGSVEIVQYLLNKGVALETRNRDNETPLMMAIQRSHKEVAELLINSGADIHYCNRVGNTLLHVAYSLEIVHCLVNKGIALNTKNLNGDTPLHYAAKYPKKQKNVAEYLLKAGADYNLEDNSGESSFNYLIKNKHDAENNVPLIKLCIEKGAYVKSDDYNRLLENPLQKRAILQDVEVCSQALINKFNNNDLPLFYKRLASGVRMPHIDKMKLENKSGMVLVVKQAVTNEIQEKGFCNINKMVPLVLSMLCVKSFIEI